jgi:hypothetical protein
VIATTERWWAASAARSCSRRHVIAWDVDHRWEVMTHDDRRRDKRRSHHRELAQDSAAAAGTCWTAQAAPVDTRPRTCRSIPTSSGLIGDGRARRL